MTGGSGEDKVRRRARFRRRLTLPKPKIPRPKIPKPKAPSLRVPRPKIPKPKAPGARVPSPRVPKPPEDLWFRLVTRLRAMGYWLREKGRVVLRWLRQAADAVVYWWSKRSRGTRIRIFSVAGVLVLYLILKFLPVPGVPCEVSAAKECAPSNQTIAFVPKDAQLYVHLTVNSDSHQWELAKELQDQLPGIVGLIQSDTKALAAPATRPIDVSGEILPWAKDDLAELQVPGPKGTVAEALIVGVGDTSKANQFLASVAPQGKTKQPKVGGVAMTVHTNGFASARAGDELVFGDLVAVRGALAAKSGAVPALEDSDQDSAREGLPDVRLAELYLSRAGIDRLLAGRAGAASQLDTFVDYGAATAMAVGLRARDDGAQIDVVSALDPKLEQRSPTVFADLPRFEPGLADEASPKALGYIGIGDLGPAVNNALTTAGSGAQGLAGAVRALAQSLKQQAGVDPLKDLLPSLGGQAALVVEPTGGLPYASLIVDGVDEKKAGDALASLQGPIVKSLSAGGPQVPSFQTSEIEGVTVHSVLISPTVNLSYALFDGKLVVSTQPEGIAQVRSSGDNLAGAGAYEAATDHLPDSVSALVFLNLDEVLGLAQLAGLAEDPLYASLSEDISHIQSLGLAVRGSHQELHSELFLALDN